MKFELFDDMVENGRTVDFVPRKAALDLSKGKINFDNEEIHDTVDEKVNTGKMRPHKVRTKFEF